MHPSLVRLLAGCTTLVLIATACSGDDGIAPPPVYEVARVEVSGAGAEVAVGDTLHLVARAWDAEGALLEDVPVSWRTYDPAVARVDARGVVAALDSGDAEILVSAGDEWPAERVVVVRARWLPRRLVVTGMPPIQNLYGPYLRVGSLDTAEVVAYDARGSAVPGAPVAFASSNVAILTVDAAGVVRGVAEGDAWLRLTSGRVRDSVPVRVYPALAGSPSRTAPEAPAR